MTKVFIDGSAGTTGLRIYDRLINRQDIELITLPEQTRKDFSARKAAIENADIAVLCLPDQATTEMVAQLGGNTRIIDTSTAHRTNKNFVYGMPELKGFKEKIKNAQFVANPGCHASGFIALVYPLIQAGILEKSTNLSCFSLTGYSGGGKKMIAEYEDKNKNILFSAPRHYALSQEHKHLKEMQVITGIDSAPVFCPVVADFYSGMLVSVPLNISQINGNLSQIEQVYKEYYSGKVITYNNNSEEGFLSAAKLSGFDNMEISVQGNSQRFVLTARYDNLGKGASGAAIQNLNIMLGSEETLGLKI